MLDNLSFSRFKAYFRVEERIRLPRHTGSVFHDALGRSFWKAHFGMREGCEDCSIRSECRYQNLRTYFYKAPWDHPFIKPHFEQLDLMLRRGRPNLPQPFVFDPVNGGEYEPGDLLVFPFTLVGKAIEHFPFMACALSVLDGWMLGLGGGNVALEAIVDGFPSEDGNRPLIYDARAGSITGPCQVEDFERLALWAATITHERGPVRKVLLRFLSPFRYKVDNKLGVPLTFEILVKNLLRRMSLLSVHSPLSTKVDHRRLLGLARDIAACSPSLEWDRLQRHSYTQNSWMSLDGYVGEIVFEGDLSVFLPFLKLGEFLNVGKAASFGHGKYALEILASGME